MKALRYLSVCSGIEAASVAWRPLGWEAAARKREENERTVMHVGAAIKFAMRMTVFVAAVTYLLS